MNTMFVYVCLCFLGQLLVIHDKIVGQLHVFSILGVRMSTMNKYNCQLSGASSIGQSRVNACSEATFCHRNRGTFYPAKNLGNEARRTCNFCINSRMLTNLIPLALGILDVKLVVAVVAPGSLPALRCAGWILGESH